MTTPVLDPSDSPRGFKLLVIVLNLLLFTGMLAYAWLDPDGFARQLAKDASPGGGGAFEHLTVLVLLPGIVCGFYAFWRYRARLPFPLLGYWILLWVLACIYFAGEEASWGQWYFHWGTPEQLAKINYQRETNLHNIGTWLDQPPRLMVELFVIVGGFLVPLWRTLGKRNALLPGAFLSAAEGWIFAPVALLPAGLLFVMLKVFKMLPQTAFENLGSGELREFAIAWFLMWYLISFAVRLRQLPPAGAPRV